MGMGSLPACNPHPLHQLTSDVEMYAFQYETKTSSSDSTVVLYLEKVRKAGWPPPETRGPAGGQRTHGQHPGQCCQRAIQSEVSSSDRRATLSLVMAKALRSVPHGRWPWSARTGFPSPSSPTRKTQCWASGSTGCYRRNSCRLPRSPYTTTTSLVSRDLPRGGRTGPGGKDEGRGQDGGLRRGAEGAGHWGSKKVAERARTGCGDEGRGLPGRSALRGIWKGVGRRSDRAGPAGREGRSLRGGGAC